MPHRGVAVDDPRNAGPIEFFRPKPVTRESLRRTLTAILGDKDPADVESRIEKTMQTIARGPLAPDPPVSQSWRDTPCCRHRRLRRRTVRFLDARRRFPRCVG